MGIMDFIEEAAGALGADKALEAVDPNAGILAKGAAAIAGFEGVSMLKNRLSGDDDTAQEQASADDDHAADGDQDADTA